MSTPRVPATHRASTGPRERAPARRATDAGLPAPALIGALLRVPAQAVQRRLIAGLNASGFRDLRLPHMAVLQYPGPNGCRPLDLARYAGISKQAMNQLLNSLEELGYVARTGAERDGRARRVGLTARGESAWARMIELLVEEETAWRRVLGARRFRELKALLTEVWESGLGGMRPEDV